MNPFINKLQLYPFEKLNILLSDIKPPSNKLKINFGIGEPQHSTPQLIKDAFINSLNNLSHYPTTIGMPTLRKTIAQWLQKRYKLHSIDWHTQILPASGTREALFAIAQTIVDSRNISNPIVMIPNPFYQIYEGACLCSGAYPYYVNSKTTHNFACDYNIITPDIWKNTQLVYICTPSNPTGTIFTLDDWNLIFKMSDLYGFVIASDECYSEIYFHESSRPIGALEAAEKLGRDFTRILVFSSLSKRSNVPGMRSGFIAGDATLISKFLLYRTYHGSALNPVTQIASIAAWNDENHVISNRKQYIEKFNKVLPLLKQAKILDIVMPDAGFYLWIKLVEVEFDDQFFARDLYAKQNVVVLPGSFLSRKFNNVNPGKNFIRIALVANLNECLEGIKRIVEFCNKNF